MPSKPNDAPRVPVCRAFQGVRTVPMPCDAGGQTFNEIQGTEHQRLSDPVSAQVREHHLGMKPNPSPKSLIRMA